MGEVELHFPGSLERWRRDPKWSRHGGESFEEVHVRAVTTFYDILRLHVARGHQGALVVVSNGALIRCIVGAARGLEMHQSLSEWGNFTAEQDAITLVEVTVNMPPDGQPQIPEGCNFKVISVGCG